MLWGKSALTVLSISITLGNRYIVCKDLFVSVNSMSQSYISLILVKKPTSLKKKRKGHLFEINICFYSYLFSIFGPQLSTAINI